MAPKSSSARGRSSSRGKSPNSMKKSSSRSSGTKNFYPHTSTSDEVLAYYSVNPKSGLTESQVEEHREKYGVNELDQEEGKSLLELIKEQFEDQLVKILLGAAGVSFVLAYFDEESEEGGFAAYVEPIVILLILIANAIVGIWQEKKADNALEALKKLQPECAQVLREGKWMKIDASEVVVGDIVEVRTGDRIPADLRMIEVFSYFQMVVFDY